MAGKPLKSGKTPEGVRWRSLRRTVDVLEHECVYCGKWFDVKRPDTQPKTCSSSCRSMLSRQRTKAAAPTRGTLEMNMILVRAFLLTLILFHWASPSFADHPTVGDLIYFDGGSCSVLHLDPATGVADVISRWDCGGAIGSTIGIGPTDWTPSDSGDVMVGPDGGIYIKGFGTPCCAPRLYRVDPETGNREFLVVIPEAASDSSFGFFVWPAPSYFAPAVAALSVGSVVLLVGLLASVSRRQEATRNRGVKR